PAETPNAAPSGDGPAVAEAGDAVPPPSQTDAKGGLSWFSVNGDQTGSASTATAETIVVGTGTTDTSSVTAPETTAPADLASTSTSASSTDTSVIPSGTTSEVTASAPTAASGSNASAEQAATTSDATTAPAPETTVGSDDAALVSAAGAPVSDGARAPPGKTAAWNIKLANGAPHTVSVAVAGAQLQLTIDTITTSRPVADVTSLSVTGGDENDSFTVDGSVAAAGIPVTLDGGSGDDVYALGDNFGTVTVVGSKGDTLD